MNGRHAGTTSPSDSTGIHAHARRIHPRRVDIAIVIIGVLLSLVVPSFVRVAEQNRVDAASQYLRSIWSAERIYWLENKTFTSSLSDLQALGLIDTKIAAGNDGYFNYSITDATSSTFTVDAVRRQLDLDRYAARFGNG